LHPTPLDEFRWCGKPSDLTVIHFFVHDQSPNRRGHRVDRGRWIAEGHWALDSRSSIGHRSSLTGHYTVFTVSAVQIRGVYHTVPSVLRVDFVRVSRHRVLETQTPTPEHYWEVGMADRAEQQRRGQIMESDSPFALNTRHPHYKHVVNTR
uniref:VASt domain-containing protein n=1 Tax=Anisakis simplex TaxID=6269 RepID=A0A0M3KGB0_ANISI